MDSLIALKNRLNYLGGDAEDRIDREKLNTLKKALLFAYQSASITVYEESFRALINPDKLKQDYDDKIVSTPFENNLKPGDVFRWNGTDTYWIVYLHQLSERAYFRGSIRKCDYELQWIDEIGQVRKVRAAIRGPVETKIVNDYKSGLSYDLPNYTLSILIPNNQYTKKVFKRYYKIMLDGVSWEVQSVNTVSMPGIVELTLKESYKNIHEDTDDLIDGKLIKNIVVQSSLDGITEISVNEEFGLWTNIFYNSEELQMPIEYEVLEGNAIILDNTLTLLEEGPTSIKISIPEAEYEHIFSIVGVVDTEEIITFNIDGPTMVKPYGETDYVARKYINGLEVEPTGNWVLEPSPRYSIVNQDAKNLKLKWLITQSGKVRVVYKENDFITGKEIIIQSLF